MMLNEIFTISNAIGILSGTGRPQALKDGSFACLAQFADNPKPQEKNFLSILSQLGAGSIQASPEESKNANQKLAEGRLPDEVKADNAVAGKPKGKQGKGGGVVKRLPSVYPEVLGLVMGPLSIPDPPQPDLSVDIAFHVPDSENEQEIAAGLTVGKLLPETMASNVLPGEPTFQTGNLSMIPVLSDSYRDSVVQDETVATIPVKGKLEVKMISEADITSTDRAQAVPVKGLPKATGQRPEPSLTRETVPSGAELGKSVQVETVQAETVQAETVQVETVQVETVQAETGKAQAVEAKTPRMFQGRQQPDGETVSEADLSGTDRVQAAPVKGLPKAPGQRPEPTLTRETVPSGAELGKSVQAETVQTETVQAETVQAETGKAQAVEAKAPRMFQGRQQPDVETVSEADLSNTVRVQAVPVKGTPKLHRLQHSDPVSIPDAVNLGPLSEKINLYVKGDQTQRLFSDQSMDAAVREKEPTAQKEDPDNRPQAVKGKSASFYPAIDSVETGEITAVSTGTSNAEDNDTPNMFMFANPSATIAGGAGDSNFQLPELESGDLAVNYVRESQVEKTSWVNPSPKESRSEGQPFHTEVLKQVVEKTSTSLKSGPSEIRIDLKPESLGHLRLHVSTDHQQVTVKILAENPLVKEMIENQASLIKNELQHQGIHVNTIKVDMLMSGGSDFAYSQHEGTAFKQSRHEPAYGSGKVDIGDSASNEPDSLDQANNGGTLVNYFA